MDVVAQFPPVVPDVVAEHLDEFAFLSIQRRKLLFSSEASLAAVKRLEDRREAHWDGLVVAGAHALALAEERLEADDPWDIAVAARVWISLGQPGCAAILERIGKAKDEALASWKEALRAQTPEGLTRVFPDALLSEAPDGERSVLIDAFGWHDLIPRWCIPINARHGDSRVRAALARTLGWASDEDVADRVLSALSGDGIPIVRSAAIWSRFLRRPGDGVAACRALLRGGSEDVFPLEIMGLAGSAEDFDLLAGFLETPAKIAAIRALGNLGNPQAVPLLARIATDSDEETFKAARGAIRMLVGEIPDDGDPAAFESWWRSVSESFREGKRFLRGVPFPAREWGGDTAMESLWRAAVLGHVPDIDGLRKEVPDGFFTGHPIDEAVPAE